MIEKLMWSSYSVYLLWWWSTQDISPVWRIHKYRLIGKRNPNGQFPHRNRVEFIPSVGKKFSTMTDFELSVRIWFRSARLKEWGCQILRNVVGHRSLSNVLSTSQFVCAELNEFGLQKKKTVLKVRRTSTSLYALLHTFSQRLIADEKIKFRAFLSHQWLPLKIKKRKMDQMDALKYRHLVT